MVTGTRGVIAIVDDEESVRNALSRLLRSAGFTPVTFASGADFMAWSAKSSAQCVVLDLHMPHLDGFEVSRQLALQRSKVPLIIITGHDMPEAGMRAVQDVAHAYLHKPVDDVLLLTSINAALGTSAPLPGSEAGVAPI